MGGRFTTEVGLVPENADTGPKHDNGAANSLTASDHRRVVDTPLKT